MRIFADNQVAENQTLEVNWFFTLILALSFSSSGFSLLIAETLGSSTLGHIVLGLGVLMLLCPFPVRRFQCRPTQPLKNLRFIFAIICGAALLSCVVVISDPKTNEELTRLCAIKTLGLGLTLVSTSIAAPLYRPRELKYGLFLFCLIELVSISLAFLLFDVDYNENTVGNRTATIGLVSAACLAPNLLRYPSLFSAAAVSIALQCRTSAVAMVLSVFAGEVEQKSRNARVFVVLGIFLMAGLVGFFADEGMRGLKQFARQNLGSSNPVAKFFLSDKNRAKVDSDFLDRNRVWRASAKLVAERPFFGWGIGTEHERRRVRSHNAYLSLAYEGGVIYLAAWLVFYFVIGQRMLGRTWAIRFASTVTGRAMVYLLAYMTLSALVESSGLGSISTPVNVIFLFLAVWSAQWFEETSPGISPR